MPPGNHAITPKNTATGRGVSLKVKVGPEMVDRLNAQAEQIRAAGHSLFIDFNHNEDNGAAGHVDNFFWAGDHPTSGGIRANVRWTAEGAKALQGRQFTRFSPCFAADRSGSIGGLSTANVGGLTNRPAFAENERIVQATQTTDNMTQEEIKELVATAIAEAIPGAIAAGIGPAITAYAAENGMPPTDKKDKKEAMDDEEDAEKAEMKATIARFEAKEAAELKTRVDTIVAQATAQGYIAPKDDKAIEAFRAQATASPELAETLLRTAPGSAEPVTDYSASVTPEGSPRERNTYAATADSIESQIAKYIATNGCDHETAFAAVAAANPALVR